VILSGDVLQSAAAVLAPCCHDPPEARNALQKGI
jgi:hypothetical protein